MRKTIKFHSINLQIDVENLADHTNYDQALITVKAKHKRLATNEEQKALSKLPRIWDKDRKGTWIAERKEDLMNPEKSVFLPALGYREYHNNKIYFRDIYGYYWSSTQDGSTNGYMWSIGNSNSRLYDNLNKANGFSVRAVKSIKKK